MIIQYKRVIMQIRSDDQQFQDLQENTNYIKQVKQSAIRSNTQQRDKKNYRVQILAGQSMNEMNLLQNQYYTITVFKDDLIVKRDINRRFSDFDMLFQILFREYKGHILPAFPQNGIVSYVKSKVSLTKDDKFLKQRIAMVQRFLTILLNQTTFNYQNTPQIRAFLSQKQFDLFKKREKQKSQGIISLSWSKIVNYIKLNKQNKYKIVQDQLIQDKKKIQQLYRKIKCTSGLLEQQKQEYNNLRQKNINSHAINEYLNKVQVICEAQEGSLIKLRKIQFQALCENQDYLMVIKLLQNIDQLKNNQENYSTLEKAERTFSSEYQQFRNNKKQSLNKLSISFDNILKDISRDDSKFR